MSISTREKNKLYYQIARHGAQDLKTPVMRELLLEAECKKKILDLGCGDGTRLSMIAKGKRAVGVDSNDFAIKEGKRRYPGLRLIKGNVEKLPFNNGEFDFVYSAFVLEHLKSPKKVIREAIRVLKEGGTFSLAAPNYGAPNRRSPCSTENKYLKLIKGFVKDFFLLVGSNKDLLWKKVKPKTNEAYEIDFDTEIEPYILPLLNFLKGKGLKITKFSTFWEIEEENTTFLFKIVKTLGKIGIFPFKFWGPQILVIAKKV